ncbi:MAG: mandelate racemase/muconate lactonizing enzyme family protein [Actinomycetia bacterium]|nr:mandelate racemase/muconate lactonizing enzyme family protein [Actinomycetes bacterium]MCP4228155.1 mandelate racemase/muconate lactonizing enzyme family protein [Actinomycetes bacterium]MCP5035659.1 mandelate racemase/muconate lactonizing enzyme family protein [Actinomycetes bacterium]
MATIEYVKAEILAQEALINCIVRVGDSDGGEGVGEAWWGIADRHEPPRAAAPIASVVNDLLAPRVIGRAADHIERIWSDCWDWGYRYADQGIFLMGLSGLDLALWDLKGKRLGCSVASLLGGPATDSIPAYASFPPLREPALLISETKRAVDYGFDAIKLHELDPELTALLRDEFGDELAIMVDVNGHFDPIEAIRVGRRLSELDVVWFEEPVRPMRDHEAIARVGAAVDCDLAGGENEYTLEDFDRLLATGTLAYLQPEITKIGGLTAARKVGALAELYNVALCPHNFRLGPALYASIQWAFTSPASRWLELPWVPEGVAFSHPAPLPTVVDGRVAPIEGPGLGAEPVS